MVSPEQMRKEQQRIKTIDESQEILSSRVSTGASTDTTSLTQSDYIAKMLSFNNVGSASTVTGGTAEWKASCRVATTARITLENLQTVDGVSLAAGDRVLVKDQTTTDPPTPHPDNGIYVVVDGAAWTRAEDADEGAEILHFACFVREGTVHADTMWLCATDFDPATYNISSQGLEIIQYGAATIPTSIGELSDVTLDELDAAEILMTTVDTPMTFHNLNFGEAVRQVILKWWNDLLHSINDFMGYLYRMGYVQVDHRKDSGFDRSRGDTPYTYLTPGSGDMGNNPAGYMDWNWLTWLGNAWHEILYYAHLDQVWDEIVIIYNRGYYRKFDEDTDTEPTYITDPNDDDYVDWSLVTWFKNTWADILYYYLPGLGEWLNFVFTLGYKQENHRVKGMRVDTPYTYITDASDGDFEEWSWSAWLGNTWREILYFAHLDEVWDEVVVIYNRGYERHVDTSTTPSTISYITPEHADYDETDTDAPWMLGRWFENTWLDIIHWFKQNSIGDYLVRIYNLGYTQLDQYDTTVNPSYDPDDPPDPRYTYDESSTWSLSNWFPHAWNEILHFFKADSIWAALVDFGRTAWDFLVKIWEVGYTQTDHSGDDGFVAGTTDRYTYDHTSEWTLGNWFQHAWDEILYFFRADSVWEAIVNIGDQLRELFNMGFVQEAHGENDPNTPTTYTYITDKTDTDYEDWNFLTWISNAASRIISDISTQLDEWWEGITTAVNGLVDTVWKWINTHAADFLTGVINALSDFGKTAWDSLVTIWNRGYTRNTDGTYNTSSPWTLTKWFTNVITDASAALGNWFSGLTAFGTGLTAALGTWFSGLTAFGAGLTTALNDWFDDLTAFGTGLTAALNTWFDGLTDFGDGLTNTLTTTLNTWWGTTVQAAGSVWEWIATNASEFLTGVINALKTFGKASWDSLVTIWNRGYDRTETNGMVTYDTSSTWTISKWFGNIIRDSYVALNTWWTNTIQAVGSVWEWISTNASEFLTGVINAVVGVGETLWDYLIDSDFFLWGYDYHPTIVNEDGTTGGYVTPDNVDRLVDYDGDGSWNITHFVANLMRLAGGAINDAWLALVDLGKVSLVTLKRIGSDIWLAIEHVGDFLWSKIQGFFALGYNRDDDGSPITDDTEMGFGWSLGNLITNLVGELTDAFVTFSDTLYTSLRNLAYLGFDYSSDIKTAHSTFNEQKNAVDYSMPLADQFDIDSTWTWERFWLNLIELTDDFLTQFAGDMWTKLKTQIITIASDVWGQITSGIGSFAENIWKGLQIGTAYADEEETTPTAESERQRQVLRDFAEFFKIDAGSKKLDMNTYDIENVDRILFKTNDGINPDLEFSYWTGKNENLDSATDDPNRGLFGFIREGDAEFAIYRRLRNDDNNAWISKVLLSVNKTTSSIHSPLVVTNPERTADVTSIGAFYKKWDTAGDDDTVDIWVYTKDGARRLSDIVSSGTSGNLTVGGTLKVNGSTILGKNDNHDVVIKAGYLYFQTDYDGVRAEDGNNGIIWKDDDGNVKLISGGVERNLSNVVAAVAPTLRGLSDTNLEADSNIANNEVLAWNGTKWINSVINTVTRSEQNILDKMSALDGGSDPDYLNVKTRLDVEGVLRPEAGIRLAGNRISSPAHAGDMWVSGSNVIIRSGNQDVTIARQVETRVASLNDIGNVNAASPGDNQILSWNNSSSRWIARTLNITGLSAAQTNVLNTLSVIDGGSDPDYLNVNTRLDVEGVLRPEAGIRLGGGRISNPALSGDMWLDGSNVVIRSGGHDVTIAPATSGSIDELSDIGDVSTNAATDGQVLTWDDDEWVPSTLSTGALTTPQQNVLNLLSVIDGGNDPDYLNVSSRLDVEGVLQPEAGISLRGSAISNPSNGDIWLSGSDVKIHSGGDDVTIALGGNATVASLNDIGNVNAASPADNQVLSWDSTSSKWIPETVATGSVSKLGDIGDVSTTAARDNQVLAWVSNQWVPTTLSTGALTTAQAAVLAELSYASSTGLVLGRTSPNEPRSMTITGGLTVAATTNLNSNANFNNGVVRFNNGAIVGGTGATEKENLTVHGNVLTSGYTQVGTSAGPSNGHIWYDTTADKLKARVDGSAVDISTGGGSSSGGSANVAQGFTDKAPFNANGFWIPVVQADLTYANCDANFGNHNGAMGIIVTTTSSLSTSAINLCWKIRNTWYYKRPNGSIAGEASGKRYTEVVYTKKAMFPSQLYDSRNNAQQSTPNGPDRWSIWGDAGTRSGDDSGIMVRRSTSGSAIGDYAEFRSDRHLGNNSSTPSSRPDKSYSFVGTDLESTSIRLPNAQQLSDAIGYDDGYIGFNRSTLQICVRVNIWWTFNKL